MELADTPEVMAVVYGSMLGAQTSLSVPLRCTRAWRSHPDLYAPQAACVQKLAGRPEVMAVVLGSMLEPQAATSVAL